MCQAPGLSQDLDCARLIHKKTWPEEVPARLREQNRGDYINPSSFTWVAVLSLNAINTRMAPVLLVQPVAQECRDVDIGVPRDRLVSHTHRFAVGSRGEDGADPAAGLHDIGVHACRGLDAAHHT